ncbi:hypothetical protein C9374_007997 [Naegleria lovaniensis]|uniref:Endoplasmic reticulum transmembrane protein n=1 Tax=Naegleria lovaniensis TaxID=51637 RepID=A0AA88GG99_NAELO|nr:uncharacterized protein C9374_007997 [Naegleria lovaniensis]KAG2378849.1 hypothetical protein C9374_007997 [Naegleria lovaniensis]
MSMWWFASFYLAIASVIALLLLFVPIPTFARTKIMRVLDKAKVGLFVLVALFLVLAVMEFRHMSAQHTLTQDPNMGVKQKFLHQVKEFRAQRNFYMCAIGAVLSLILVGLNAMHKKIHDLQDKLELSTKTK